MVKQEKGKFLLMAIFPRLLSVSVEVVGHAAAHVLSSCLALIYSYPGYQEFGVALSNACSLMLHELFGL